MVEAIPIAAAQAQILAARLFAQATAQGQAILAAAATSDSTNNQPQTGGDPGQRGAGLPTPQTAQQAATTGPQAGASPSPGAATASPTLPPSPNLLAGAANPPPQAPQAVQQATTAGPQAGASPSPGAATPSPAPPPGLNLLSGAASPPPQAATTPPILTRAALVADLPPPTLTPAGASSAPATRLPLLLNLPAPPPAPARTAPTPPPSPAVGFARIEAVARQDTAAPLLADLEAVVAQDLAPPQVRAAARAVLAAVLPLEPDVTAQDLKQAVRNSGIFLEARLAQTPNPQIAADSKGALMTLLRALRIWSVPAAPEEPRGTVEDNAVTDGGPDGSPSSGATGTRAAPAAPPPIKGQPPRPQAPTASNLSADITPAAVRAQLIKRTDAAVARTTLLQMASSESGEARSTTAPSSASWLFELPVTTPQGPTTLPFEIDRDGDSESGATGVAAQTAWRVRFAFDIEPVGPVWVQAQLRGSSAAVTVLAERAGVAEALSRRAGDLTDSLAAEGLEAHVSVSNGAPAAPAAAPGRFLDRAT